MKPAPFRYLRSQDVGETLEGLTEHGDEAKLLAGGQSLVAMMNLRLARPEVLIDINEVPGLAHIILSSDGLRVGALTRHRQIERYPAPLKGFELLPQAAKWVGHHSIRTRGTLGGSIAHADPAAEWCLLAVLLDAEMTVTSTRGTRSVAAQGFFKGFLTTALQPDEMLLEVRFPTTVSHASIQEFARRHGDFAVVAAAVAFDLHDGRCSDPRVALGGVDATPVRATAAEWVLTGAVPTAATFAAAARAAAAAIHPPEDVHGDATYRRELSELLVRRALHDALGPSEGGSDG